VTDLRKAVALAAATVCLAGAAPAGAQGVAAEWPALVKRFEAQVARTPSDASVRFTLAMLYARDGRLLDGYRQLQEADAVAGAARRAELTGQVAREAQALLKQNPHDLLARYRLAFVRYFQGDLAAATVELERIVAAEPKNDWGYGYLGQAYAAGKQDDRAIEVWQRGLRVNPNNSVLHYVLGLMYTKKNDRKNAARHFAAAYRDRTLYDYVTGNRR
jgi:predicted Zn-dependent protease